MSLLAKNNKKAILSIVFLFASSCLLSLPAVSGAWQHPTTGPADGSPSAGTAQASGSLNPLRDALLAFFAPMRGSVLNARDGLITASIANGASVVPGMRLKVFKQGAEFYDPLTGAPIERTELPSGKALVINATVVNSTSAGKKPSDRQVTMKLMAGQAIPGDIVRQSASKVRILFYQLKNVSWGLSEAYYNLLKETGRFDLLASPLEDEKDALSEGRRVGADAVLIISQDTAGGNVLLTQKLLWTSDGSQVLADKTIINSARFKMLTFADKFFVPERNKSKNSFTMFNVPYGAHFISFFQPARGAPKLLLMASDNKVFFYGISPSRLSAALSGARIKTRPWQEFLKIETADLNGDGSDLIIIGAKSRDRVVSFVYGLEKGAFRKLWEGKDLFLRWVGGRLYAQKVGMGRGYEGPVLTARWDGKQKQRQKRIILGSAAALPKGTNIFGFTPMQCGGKDKNIIIAYDGQGYINVYDRGALVWRSVWRSPGSFGGFSASFKKASYSPMETPGRWHIEDVIKVIGRDALFIERKPILSMASGLGYMDSRIGVLRWNGASMKLMVLGDKLPGSIMDFAATKKSLMILESPVFGLQLGRLLKGDSPFTARLYMYPLEGE